MNILKRLRLRTKLALVMLLASLALIASVTVAASVMRSRMMTDRVREVQAVTHAAVGLARSLEEQVTAHQLRREQAVAQFRKAAHAIRFDDGAGYIVAMTLDDRVIVHGANVALEDKPSLARLPDGRSLVEPVKAALVQADEGHVSYLFVRPGEKVPQPKVAYIERFRPWDVVFVVGAYTDDIDAAFRRTVTELALLSGGILALTLLACWLVSRDISRSLGRLKASMQGLAGGDLSAEVTGTDRRDEVGEMAVTVGVFKENAITVQRLKAEREAAEKRRADERRASMEQVAHDFEVGVGDVVKFVASAANNMQTTAESMTTMAEETSRQVTAVAAASEQASTNVQAVSGAAEELSASVSEISRQVANSSSIAAQAVSDAERTNTLVAALADAAKQIGAVTEMINEIASKTNLLAV